jgi:DNA-binding HxlR family transcriptional regulator
MDNLMNGLMAKKRPQECPYMDSSQYRAGLYAVAEKWKMAIVSTLMDGPLRFGEIRKTIPDITQHMLTLQLRDLERSELLVRTAFAEIPPRVVYALTESGHALKPVCDSLLAWSEEHGKKIVLRYERLVAPFADVSAVRRKR